MKITIFQYIVKIGTYPIKNPQTANSNNKKKTTDGILAQGKKIAIVLGIVVIAFYYFHLFITQLSLITKFIKCYFR